MISNHDSLWDTERNQHLTHLYRMLTKGQGASSLKVRYWVQEEQEPSPDVDSAYSHKYMQCKPIKIYTNYRDFPGGPVVKTLCSQCRVHGFNRWLWNKDPTCRTAQPKKICIYLSVYLSIYLSTYLSIYLQTTFMDLGKMILTCIWKNW